MHFVKPSNGFTLWAVIYLLLLLLNLQVEPSPTTGSLTKPMSVQESVSSTYPVTTARLLTNTFDDKVSGFFEFNSNNRSNTVMEYLLI